MQKIAIAKGDGIGPEIMDAVLNIFNSVNVPLEYQEVEMGKWVYDKGHPSGMTQEAKDIIENCSILFKGPMETPKGKGIKSLNVTARKTWNTFANVRVFKSLPGVETIFSKANIPINITIIRENIEDTYGGIEHLLSYDLALCRRFISRPGCAQVLRYTFDMASKYGIKKITCGHKANIMKLTDGLFLETFYAIASEYPHIQANDIIVDDLCMKLVTRPDLFEAIVLTNFQGDIVSDLCAGLVGGLGFAPSSNIGNDISIFEAVHGTAPDIAGKNMANPTALLLSGIAMLRHLGIMVESAIIENALLYSLEQHIRTKDFGNTAFPAYSTSEFTQKIIENIGKKPSNYSIEVIKNFYITKTKFHEKANTIIRSANKPSLSIQGFDYFVAFEEQPAHLINICLESQNNLLKLTGISNRGTQIWPNSSIYTNLIELYCCRFEKIDENSTIEQNDMIDIFQKLSLHFTVFSIETLHKLQEKMLFSSI